MRLASAGPISLRHDATQRMHGLGSPFRTVDSQVCASCPTFRQARAKEVCNAHVPRIGIAFGEKGDAIDVLGKDWRLQWRTKV